MLTKPGARPARPHFSSGPCAKPPGWNPERIDTRSLGRSHRSALGKERLQHCIDLMRWVFSSTNVPAPGKAGGNRSGYQDARVALSPWFYGRGAKA